MNKMLFKKALEHYRNQEELEEIELAKDKRYQFMDIDDGYIFPLNNIDEITISELFIDKNSEEDCDITDISKFVNLKELEKVLANIDKKYFFFLNEILVLLEEEDIDTAEDYLCRELLEGTVGQTTGDTNSIVINMFDIFNRVKDVCESKESFFKTSIKEFYITLLHELGHVCLRNNFLNKEYLPFESDISDEEEEEFVEDMSDLLFCELDDSMDVFKPFNKAFVESQF